MKRTCDSEESFQIAGSFVYYAATSADITSSVVMERFSLKQQELYLYL